MRESSSKGDCLTWSNDSWNTSGTFSSGFSKLSWTIRGWISLTFSGTARSVIGSSGFSSFMDKMGAAFSGWNPFCSFSNLSTYLFGLAGIFLSLFAIGTTFSPT